MMMNFFVLLLVWQTIPSKVCESELLDLQRRYTVNSFSFMQVKSSYRGMTGNLVWQSHAIPSIISDLVHRLSQDSSHEVQSYVLDLTHRPRSVTESDGSSVNVRHSRMRLSIFSRPPQTLVSVGPGAMLVEWSSSGDSANSIGGSSRSLHPRNGNNTFLDNPGNPNHAVGDLSPPSSGVCNTDGRFGNANERVTVSG